MTIPTSLAVTGHEAQENVPVAALGFEPRVTQLRALVSVAREASYTKAARILSYTESGVFLQIRALEKLAGVSLVRKAGPRIELTPAGQVVYRYALRILEDVEGMSRDLIGLRTNQPVVIGGGRSTSAYYLMPLIAEFSREFPRFNVQLHIMSAEDLITAAEDGVVDLAVTGGIRHLIANGRRAPTGLRLTPWFHGGWSFVTAPGAAEVADLPVVYVPDFAAFLIPSISEALSRLAAPKPPPTLVTIAGSDTVKNAALHGMCGGVLPAIAVSIETSVGLLHSRNLDLGPERVMLVHRQPRLLTEGSRLLLGHLLRSRRRFSAREGNDSL